MNNTRHSFTLIARRGLNARRSFTLIELLVVISIIAILAGLIVPTYLGVRQNAKKVKARSTVKNLETAFKEYLNHYRVWPTVVADESAMTVDNDLYEILRGDKVGSDNPDEIAFFEFESMPGAPDATTAYDPWKYDPDGNEDWQAYRVMFDKNYDNKINIGGVDIYRSVLVWSVGTNRQNNSGTIDDITSWK